MRFFYFFVIFFCFAVPNVYAADLQGIMNSQKINWDLSELNSIYITIETDYKAPTFSNRCYSGEFKGEFLDVFFSYGNATYQMFDYEEEKEYQNFVNENCRYSFSVNIAYSNGSTYRYTIPLTILETHELKNACLESDYSSVTNIIDTKLPSLVYPSNKNSEELCNEIFKKVIVTPYEIRKDFKRWIFIPSPDLDGENFTFKYKFRADTPIKIGETEIFSYKKNYFGMKLNKELASLHEFTLPENTGPWDYSKPPRDIRVNGRTTLSWRTDEINNSLIFLNKLTYIVPERLIFLNKLTYIVPERLMKKEPVLRFSYGTKEEYSYFKSNINNYVVAFLALCGFLYTLLLFSLSELKKKRKKEKKDLENFIKEKFLMFGASLAVISILIFFILKLAPPPFDSEFKYKILASYIILALISYLIMKSMYYKEEPSILPNWISKLLKKLKVRDL